MPEQSIKKKPEVTNNAGKTAAKTGQTKKRRPKSAGAQENPNAKRPAVDPYDDPTATSAEVKPRRKTSPTRAGGAAKKSGGAKKRRAAEDPYDVLVAKAEEKERERKHKRRRSDDDFDAPAPKKGSGGSGGKTACRGGGFLTFMLIALIVIGGMLIALQLSHHAEFRMMRDAVETGDFFAGTEIDGVDVSGMNMETALEHFENVVEPAYYGRTVNVSGRGSVTAAELGYSSNYADVIGEAWGAQTTGTLKERYSALQKYALSGKGYEVERVIYTEDALEEYAAELAGQLDNPVSEPSITGFDHDTLTFTFGEGKPGKTLDQEKLVSDMKAALDAGGGNVEPAISTQEPTVSMEEMESLYGMRAYAVTNASSSTTNRLTNIRLALDAINGTLLQPGEEFSFNGVVGKRTSDKGYKVATAYNAGEVTEELGGGICQVSTTLFNAVVKADLTVTERHNHSMPVSYVDKGKDAAVSWGNQDLKFVNTSDEPVYIVAMLDSDKRVRIGVFGRMLPDGKYITIEAELTYTKEFETQYQYNAFLLPGDVQTVQEGRNTYEAVAYKLTWTAEGELIDKVTLCQSKYRGRDEIIEYGPR